MKTITAEIPLTLAQRLAVAARSRGRTKAAVIREALQAYLQPSLPNGSCLDLARDLAGVVDLAPVDGWTSRRRLRRYGR